MPTDAESTDAESTDAESTDTVLTDPAPADSVPPGTQPPDAPAAAPAEFVSMWDYELGDASDNALLQGTLVVDAPCVYVVSDFAYEAGGDPSYVRFLVRLPLTGTRYDAQTGELWVWDDGPLVTGDQVRGGGGTSAPEDDATACSYDNVWAAPRLSPVVQPGFNELLAPIDTTQLNAALKLWRPLHVDEARWPHLPQSVAEIAGDSTLVVIGRVGFVDHDPIWVPQQDDAAERGRDPFANLGVWVERVVAGDFRHYRADMIQVSVWQDDIPPGETFVFPDVESAALLFLTAKDAFFADRGIESSSLGEGLDAANAAEIISSLDQGYFLTSAQGVLISTPDGLLNPLSPRQPGANEPLAAVQRDSNTMSLRELEQAIRAALPITPSSTWITDAVSYVPSPPFAAMLYDYDYGSLSVGRDVLVGTLILEAPCAYLLETLPDQPDSSASRHLLRLPRVSTRYAADTGELWVSGQGPFVSGDQVRAIGGEADDSATTECDFDRVWGASLIDPPKDLP